MFKSDLYRYYGAKKVPLRDRIFPPPQLKYLRVLRKAQYYRTRNKLFYFYYVCRLIFLSRFTYIQIPIPTKIGLGLYIGHYGPIIINPKAVLGKNINIAVGVTIGQENRGKRVGAPVIGDNVWIGSNAVIVGNIAIGNDVLIAPNSYVNFDVPDHSVVIGNPGKIIPKEKATDGYVNNRII
ncbi:MAG: serine acetyltransferase [Bacteroidaceae bacterium]|nr:serine acetyltransferase [Bacteroidaceae bacterium]